MAFLRSVILGAITRPSRMLLAVFRKHQRERIAIYAVSALAVGFIVLHGAMLMGRALGFTADWLHAGEYRLNVDRSYAEIFLYGVELSCVFLLFHAFLLSRQRLYLAWSAVFAFIFVDDAFTLHERAGHKLVTWFDLPGLPGLRAQDTGELIVWGGAAIILVPFAVREARLSDAEAHGFCCLIALCFAALIGFAVGVDMVHVLAGSWSRLASGVVAIAEDGGEMLAMVAAWACALLARRHIALQRVATAR